MAEKLFDRFKGKKVFITGNTGFKGSWLSIWLHELGAEVFGYALEAKTDMDNFVKCELESKINQTYGNVADLPKIQAELDRIQPDYIFHLAAQALVIDSYNDPVETYMTNVMGTINLLQAARSCKSLKSIVLITSDKCYENKEVVWGYRENDELGGKDPYSASKACAELAAKSFRESFYKDSSVGVVTVRAGNVIGGGDWSENRLIPDIFKSIRANETLEIRSPKATRPWEHVLEPLSGYMQLALLAENSKKYDGGWNFGPSTYVHYNVLDVATEIGKSTELNFEITATDTQFHEANFLKLDITKAANYLNWQPQLNFEETIKFTVDGYLAQDSNDLYKHRVAQISEYTKTAQKNKTGWAK
ncbi:CDP-glucose 4,6-dehydratase [Arcticibacterium luteifluviistationis]|uniref:CDP-glucose 4,6-dehydratase n=1 Tax=Arcticibacterium luteifluviistationis TaxID=1784714 RepID=A0A2Z4GI50_9BACT|nr:CDP-glucose 4,6-dehydratase [Arcticibacterium luteifluviistationis]AWW00649.1 CDP-glucose 4,6-dehydratase [Arcticibacterium luteifluviistationis]